MPYDINEGQFDFDCLEDASINIIGIPPHEDGTPLRLVVTRDKLGGGEVLKTYLSRQTRELSRRFPEYKELKREAGWLGSGEDASFSAVVLQAQFKQDGKWVFQGQCVAELPEGKLLIITLTSPRNFDDKLRARWTGLLTRFVPSDALSSDQSNTP